MTTKMTQNEFATTRWEGEFKSRKGERVKICCEKTTDYGIALIWQKRGLTKTYLPEWWTIRVYATDAGRRCRAAFAYNPTETTDHKIDFDWMIAPTAENLGKIVAEIERRANL